MNDPASLARRRLDAGTVMTGAGILDLPEEVVHDIFDYVPPSTRQCVKVCRQWHGFLQGRLYNEPKIRSTAAFQDFLSTVLDGPSDYGRHVRILDLRSVIGTLQTIRLPELMRACPMLREFYAPQAAFTPYMMQALPELSQLRLLDLECCIERFEISRVINACAGLVHLHTLRYPRCAVSTTYPIKRYPPALRHFALRGGLRDEFVERMAEPTHPRLDVSSLLVSYAPSITAPPMLRLLAALPTLRDLTVAWPCMRFGHNALDGLLLAVPALERLSLSVDYVSPRFFEHPHARLRALALRFSGVGKHRLLTVDDLVDALEHEHETDTADDDDDVAANATAGRRGGWYPSLETLSVSDRLADLLFKDDDAHDTLRRVAGERGVDLVGCLEVEDGAPEI